MLHGCKQMHSIVCSHSPVWFTPTLCGSQHWHVPPAGLSWNDLLLLPRGNLSGTSTTALCTCRGSSQHRPESSNCLLTLGEGQNSVVELKSVAINKANPNQLALAASDAYVRLYDRRMLSPGQCRQLLTRH